MGKSQRFVRTGTKDGVVNLEDSVSARLGKDAQDATVTETHTNAPKEPVKTAEPVSAIENEPAGSGSFDFEFDQIPVNKLPLHSTDISVMDHASGMDDGIKMNGNPFENEPASTGTKPAAEPAPKFEFPPDAPPLQNTGPAPDPANPLPAANNPNPSGTGLPGEIKGQIDNSLADLICNMYKDIVPEMEYGLTKLDIAKIKKFQAEGFVDGVIVESMQGANKDNKKRFKERALSDAHMLKKPLARLLNEKNINTTPTGELIIVLVFIMVGNFFLIKEIKNENTQLMNSIETRISELNSAREKAEAAQEALRREKEHQTEHTTV